MIMQDRDSTFTQSLPTGQQLTQVICTNTTTNFTHHTSPSLLWPPQWPARNQLTSLLLLGSCLIAEDSRAARRFTNKHITQVFLSNVKHYLDVSMNDVHLMAVSNAFNYLLNAVTVKDDNNILHWSFMCHMVNNKLTKN